MSFSNAEFFAGGGEGRAYCRGYEMPTGQGLYLPRSLVSVETGYDKYSTTTRLWVDGTGCYWGVRYCPSRGEWYAVNLKTDRAEAVRVVSLIQRDEQMSIAQRFVDAGAGMDLGDVRDSLISRYSENIYGETLIQEDPHYFSRLEFRDGSAVKIPHPASPRFDSAAAMEVCA